MNHLRTLLLMMLLSAVASVAILMFLFRLTASIIREFYAY